MNPHFIRRLGRRQSPVRSAASKWRPMCLASQRVTISTFHPLFLTEILSAGRVIKRADKPGFSSQHLFVWKCPNLEDSEVSHSQSSPDDQITRCIAQSLQKLQNSYPLTVQKALRSSEMAKFSDIIWEFAIRPEGPTAHYFSVHHFLKDDRLVELQWSIRTSIESFGDNFYDRFVFAAPRGGRDGSFSWVLGNYSTYVEDSVQLFGQLAETLETI